MPGIPSLTVAGRGLELRERDGQWSDLMCPQAPASSSARSWTTSEAPAAESSAPIARPVDGQDEPEATADPGLDAGQGVLDDGDPPRAPPQASGGLEEDGRVGLAGQRRRRAVQAIHLDVEPVEHASRRRTCVAFSLAEMTATRRPVAASGRRTPTVLATGSTPSCATRSQEHRVLAQAQTDTVSSPGGSPGSPSGRRRPREARKSRTPASRGLPST